VGEGGMKRMKMVVADMDFDPHALVAWVKEA
jgi:hypothetical protein